MSLAVALVLLLNASPSPDACEVLLSNASATDLMLTVHGRTVQLAPGETQRVPLASLSVIEFGAESHEFALAGAAKALCPADAIVPVEARGDGKLWLQTEEQPEGLPLQPDRVRDLTGSPPNNSSKPMPLRGTA